MSRTKGAKSKKKSKPKVKKPAIPVSAKIAPKVSKDLEAIKKERDKLIAGIQPNLLTNEQLKRGGGNTRVRYMKEMGLNNVISEINRLGKEIGQRPIGLGHLRK